MVFYHKGLRVRRTPLSFVACDRKAAILRVQIWSAHESDVVGLGFKPIDALHVAAAEQGQAEVLVTCDDGLLKTAQRHAGILQVKVMSVLRFIAEEI